MTAEQAKQFSTYGKYSVATILAKRKCNCDPYKDWFTFKRWLAQGKCAIQVMRDKGIVKGRVIKPAWWDKK